MSEGKRNTFEGASRQVSAIGGALIAAIPVRLAQRWNFVKAALKGATPGTFSRIHRLRAALAGSWVAGGFISWDLADKAERQYRELSNGLQAASSGASTSGNRIEPQRGLPIDGNETEQGVSAPDGVTHVERTSQ